MSSYLLFSRTRTLYINGLKVEPFLPLFMDTVEIRIPNIQIPETFKYRTFKCLVIQWLNHLKTRQNSPDLKWLASQEPMT